MFDMIRISFLDYRKFLFKTSTYIFTGIIFMCVFLLISQVFKFHPHDIKSNLDAYAINQVYGGFMQFVIIFQAVTLLTEEFLCATVPFLFTCNKSRTQILFSKVLSFLMFSLTICLIDFALVAYYYFTENVTINKNFFVSVLVLYLTFAWFIGNYFMFFSVISKSRATSFIVGMFISYLIGDLVIEFANKFPFLQKFAAFVPFVGIHEFLISSLNLERIISMLIGGVIFFVLSSVIFEKLDLA